jgi:hypothetical protein
MMVPDRLVLRVPGYGGSAAGAGIPPDERVRREPLSGASFVSPAASITGALSKTPNSGLRSQA